MCMFNSAGGTLKYIIKIKLIGQKQYASNKIKSCTVWSSLPFLQVMLLFLINIYLVWRLWVSEENIGFRIWDRFGLALATALNNHKALAMSFSSYISVSICKTEITFNFFKVGYEN